MKRLNYLSVLLVFALVSFTSITAQEETEAKKLLKAYISASNQLDAAIDVNNVLSFFSPNYKNNISYLGLSGVVNNSSVNYEEFAEQLAENLKNENYSFTMTINKIIYESQNKNSGIVSAIIDFESKIEGKLAEKGTILMNLVVSKIAENWKIIHNNTVRVSEAKDIGDCFCNVFSKGDMFFNAETYFPNGVEYDREYKSYRISVKENERSIVNRTNNNQSFLWKENGDIYEKGIKIGTADTNEKAIQVVLSHVYRTNCININFG